MEKMNEFKVAALGFLASLGTFLGWQGIMALAWVAAMGLDYLTGSAAACKEGKWSSSIARTGLWHKGGMIIVVCVAAMADGVMWIICDYLPINLEWPVAVLPLVLAWYILTELGSILENAVTLGARVPKWIVKLLAKVEHLVDDAADKVVDVGDTTNPYAEVFPNPDIE